MMATPRARDVRTTTTGKLIGFLTSNGFQITIQPEGAGMDTTIHARSTGKIGSIDAIIEWIMNVNGDFDGTLTVNGTESRYRSMRDLSMAFHDNYKKFNIKPASKTWEKIVAVLEERGYTRVLDDAMDRLMVIFHPRRNDWLVQHELHAPSIGDIRADSLRNAVFRKENTVIVIADKDRTKPRRFWFEHEANAMYSHFLGFVLECEKMTFSTTKITGMLDHVRRHV